MKIAHVITRRELRGAEVVASDICEDLARRGHETTLIGLYRPVIDNCGNGFQTHGATVMDMNGFRKGWPDPILLWRLTRTLSKCAPDIVQANAFHALKFTSAARWLLGARWPIVYRNVGIASQWIKRPFQRWWGKAMLHGVDHVLSVSEASRKDFSATYDVAPDRIEICRQGVRIPVTINRESARLRLCELPQCNPDADVIVHIGNFSPEKNHTGLLEAFQQILQQRPEARLILFGDGPLRSTIEQTIDSMELRNRVSLLGARRDASELVAGADLLVLASRVEGIPGAVLEAAAQAVPTVSTDVGGLREIVRDGETGKLVPAADMSALAQAVVQLLSDPKRRNEFGKSAHEFVTANHDMEKNTLALEELYQRLVDNGHLSRGELCGEAQV